MTFLYIMGGIALAIVLIACLTVPDWAREDWDHEAEIKMRGWDKMEGDQ